MRQHIMTRRQVLSSMGVGLAIQLGWNADIEAQSRDSPTFSFLVVSDTHLGRGDTAAAAQQWQLTARALEAAAGDFVLHLGDIVDQGREPQYAVYLETRRLITKPIHEIPGNHDPQELFERHVCRPVDRAFDHGGVRFLLMNNSRTDSHDGFIAPEQFGWLEEQLADADRLGLFVMIAAHVPVHENRHPDRGWHVKPRDGQTALYALLTQHRRRVLALLHGHFHNGVRGWHDHGPLQEVVLPSALYNQDRRLAEQMAPGYSLNEFRPGFVRITIDRRGMNIQYMTTGASTPAADRLCPLRQFDA
jgi:3',5'-cyclic AMP phosphodiesterase CpdA